LFFLKRAPKIIFASASTKVGFAPEPAPCCRLRDKSHEFEVCVLVVSQDRRSDVITHRSSFGSSHFAWFVLLGSTSQVPLLHTIPS